MLEHESQADQWFGLKTSAGKIVNGELGNISPWTEDTPIFTVDSQELKSFLMKNLGMTIEDVKKGIQVQVTANFVVGADGKVSDIEITELAETVL